MWPARLFPAACPVSYPYTWDAGETIASQGRNRIYTYATDDINGAKRATSSLEALSAAGVCPVLDAHRTHPPCSGPL